MFLKKPLLMSLSCCALLGVGVALAATTTPQTSASNMTTASTSTTMQTSEAAPATKADAWSTQWKQVKITDLSTTAHRYYVQPFHLDGAPEVKLVFVYAKDKLKFIRIGNVGGESKVTEIEINILGKNHVLGLHDFVTLDAPNVEKIVLNVFPYAPEMHKSVSNMLPSHTYLFTRNQKGVYFLNTVNH